MVKATGSTGFFQRMLARPVPVVDADAADFGTCYGLELSLAPLEEAPLPLPSAAPGAGGWMRRFALRTRVGP
jgi:hypothetical protein